MDAAYDAAIMATTVAIRRLLERNQCSLRGNLRFARKKLEAFAQEAVSLAENMHVTQGGHEKASFFLRRLHEMKKK